MKKNIWKYNFNFSIFVLSQPFFYLINILLNNNVATTISFFLFLIYTIIASIYKNKSKKMILENSLLTIISILFILFGIKYKITINFSITCLYVILLIWSHNLLCNEIKVSNRILPISIIGYIIVIYIEKILTGTIFLESSYLLIIFVFILTCCAYNEDNNIYKVIYYIVIALIVKSIILLLLFISIEYVIFLLKKYKLQKNNIIKPILIIVVLTYSIIINYQTILLLLYIGTSGPIVMLNLFNIALVCISRMSTKKKKNLVFTAYSMITGGIETSLVNLLKNINHQKYNIKLILESKTGELLNNIDKKVDIYEYKVYANGNSIIRKLKNTLKRFIYSIFTNDTYDYSCCYATYSLCGNKLSRIMSKNNSIYVHSNYKNLYNDFEFKEFFDKRYINKFKKIIFVSNESKKDFLNVYKSLENNCIVINNLIDLDIINKKKNEKIEAKPNPDKTLFVFVGRLDESSKKVSRLLNITKEITEIETWIIGDGKDRRKYEDMTKTLEIENRVKFFGNINMPYNYMNIANYIVLTSKYEGFPVVYQEALALKKQIITTIPVSDGFINIEDYAYIISQDEDKIVKQVKDILKKEKAKININMEQIQKEKISVFEKIINEVI